MKNIVLIGGSYGIGATLASILAPENNLIVASRTAPENLIATDIVFDALTDTLPLEQLPDKIDGLVYCPGSINLRPFTGLKIEAFETDMQINFFAMVSVVQSLLPRLLAADQASVVLFSSVAAAVGMPYHTSIAAAKGAVEGFAKAFAAEYAPKIRVNVIAPSLTQTPLANKFLNSEAKQQKSSEKNPLGRFGQPQDIAQMAAFLLSGNSSWITGQTIAVDGGMSSLNTNP